MGSKPHCQRAPIGPHESKKLQTKISVPESLGRVGHGRDMIQVREECHHDTTADVIDDSQCSSAQEMEINKSVTCHVESK